MLKEVELEVAAEIFLDLLRFCFACLKSKNELVLGNPSKEGSQGRRC